MELFSMDDELFAICTDGKHIVKVDDGYLFGKIIGDKIVSDNGRFIGFITNDGCIINQNGDEILHWSKKR